MVEEEKSFTNEDLQFHLPFCMIIYGPSSSGKSTFTHKFLAHYDELIRPTPSKIIYAYGQYNANIPELQQQGIIVHAGLPTEDLMENVTRPLLLILDDLMLTTSEQYLNELFTRRSHHEQIGVVFITQNLFEKNLKVARNNSQCEFLTRHFLTPYIFYSARHF